MIRRLFIPKWRNPLSLTVGFLALIIWFTYIFNLSIWKKNQVIQWDIISYYSYVPATFIYHDLSFKFKNKLPKDFPGKIWGRKVESTGAYVQKMTLGLAIMYTPFFLAGHVHALLGGYDANGYTEPYSMWLVIGSVIFAFLALLVLRKILLRYFTDLVTAITLIIIFFGTNLFYYTVHMGQMSHVYSFFIISVFIYYTLLWHDKPTLVKTLILALSGGIIVLIRPTNIVLPMSVFIFYNLYNQATLKAKYQLFIKNWYFIIIIIVVAFSIVFLQLLYWKTYSGEWIYKSYGKEGFFFSQPHILDGMFSYRNGWLIYTPVMILAILGIPLLFKKLKEYSWVLVAFLPIQLFIVYSWWCWWYGGSFGSRPMIDTYALLAIPMALVIREALRSKIWIYLPLLALLAFFVRLNVFQTKQFSITLLHYDSMTREVYWEIWNENKFPKDYDKMIRKPDYNSAVEGKPEILTPAPEKK